jgi:hypothetical protein
MRHRRHSSVFYLAYASVFLSSLFSRALAWGPEGHSIIAEIAQRHLTSATAAQVRQIMGGDGSLASISSWADGYRAVHPVTAGWHFVDIPLNSSNYDDARDCSPSPRGDCIVHEIARNMHALKDHTLPDHQRLEALKFLVHFVGDINQPLHTVAELTGYNDMTVCYFSTPAKNDCVETNLHAVWDFGLIRSIYYDWGAYVEYLETEWIPQNDIEALSGGQAIDWALEAHKAAHDIVVPGVKMNDHLGVEYLNAVRPTLDKQLAAAGLRLARVLNDVLN